MAQALVIPDHVLAEASGWTNTGVGGVGHFDLEIVPKPKTLATGTEANATLVLGSPPIAQRAAWWPVMGMKKTSAEEYGILPGWPAKYAAPDPPVDSL